jgi:hypothetical protein
VVVFDAAQAQASPAKNNRTLTGIATQQQIRLHPATQKRKTKSGVLNVMKKNDSTQETINQNMK